MISKNLLDQLAISESEYETIVERLGREPNRLELGMFGSLWSEHCGYKHSKALIKKLPNKGPRVLVSQGQENAGVVDIGNNLAVVMKIESHNHPSAVEPYEGAATGVGGIVRDIFAMGARPIALLNSLRFGPLSKTHNRQLLGGVVSGISGYGNCIGIPDIGGEICFSQSYTENPLVNAMCVGIARRENLMSATTGKPGNFLVLVGAQTGRDGIHGASGLASRTFNETRELRPTVQVGNPFLEKSLIEACLEVATSGLIVGMQDLGAAGLTSASVEAALNGGTGIEIDVARVPRRETDMTPYEVMLSESQERMLVIVSEERLHQIKNIFDKWNLESAVIGKATGDGLARIYNNGTLEGVVPISILTDPPIYYLDGIQSVQQKEQRDFDLSKISLPDEHPSSILLKLLASPNITSKESVYRQYDHQVQTNTVTGPGNNAAVLRIRGTENGLALTTDGNGRYCYLDPIVGGMIAVAEACRNLSTVGAQPIAITDCLNFGNPERQEVYYQLENCIKGISLASEILGAPVISGNVSLYNESHGKSIYPTPIIGALGLLQNVRDNITSEFKETGDMVILLGVKEVKGNASSLAGSEYLELVHQQVAGQPNIDLDLEAAVQRTCRRAIENRIFRSSHDCSDGGLLVCIAESCILGNIGFQGNFLWSGRWDAAFFGEDQSRIIASLRPGNLPAVEQLCEEENLPWTLLGKIGGESLVIGNDFKISVAKLAEAWHKGLDQVLKAG